jgi:Co/Zn/Cd efflux system component
MPRYGFSMSGSSSMLHRHGHHVHSHTHARRHRHLARPFRSELLAHYPDETHTQDHSHGRNDPAISRSPAGIRAVSISLAVLTVTAVAQTLIYTLTLTVALLADLIHNFGDASTAIPLGLAFFLRSARGERLAGLAVVLAIFASACVALVQTLLRFIHPHTLTHLWWLAAAGGDRLHRERDRGADPHSRWEAPEQPRARGGWQPRAC